MLTFFSRKQIEDYSIDHGFDYGEEPLGFPTHEARELHFILKAHLDEGDAGMVIFSQTSVCKAFAAKDPIFIFHWPLGIPWPHTTRQLRDDTRAASYTATILTRWSRPETEPQAEEGQPDVLLEVTAVCPVNYTYQPDIMGELADRLVLGNVPFTFLPKLVSRESAIQVSAQEGSVLIGAEGALIAMRRDPETLEVIDIHVDRRVHRL